MSGHLHFATVRNEGAALRTESCLHFCTMVVGGQDGVLI